MLENVYREFDKKRKIKEAEQADTEDLEDLKV